MQIIAEILAHHIYFAIGHYSQFTWKPTLKIIIIINAGSPVFREMTRLSRPINLRTPYLHIINLHITIILMTVNTTHANQCKTMQLNETIFTTQRYKFCLGVICLFEICTVHIPLAVHQSDIFKINCIVAAQKHNIHGEEYTLSIQSVW